MRILKPSKTPTLIEATEKDRYLLVPCFASVTFFSNNHTPKTSNQVTLLSSYRLITLLIKHNEQIKDN